MGFLTKEFTVERGQGPEIADRGLCADQPPVSRATSGCIRAERAFFPDLTVEEGVRIFLTGGMSLPGELHRRQETHEGRLLNEEQ